MDKNNGIYVIPYLVLALIGFGMVVCFGLGYIAAMSAGG